MSANVAPSFILIVARMDGSPPNVKMENGCEVEIGRIAVQPEQGSGIERKNPGRRMKDGES
ncbi:MAG: hypothetical protein ACTMKV_06405, partial [Sphingomonas parapaucimobilis]